ncbi:hypothetical protein HMPREF9087_1046 [Enterococcus casseliflavus ATCC 12755]|uniref:N-acetyltransferase domain-containing protein n=1 Tax=Enterococcus casseliflavus ATCC 12755 TaxID=888066 RepID=F0EI04_ENTCA|nr:hypothetical protein HMPREF9087_1046 [Enterococcus casseliflavus ATCC 12755]
MAKAGARLLIETAKQRAAGAGFDSLYLCTDLSTFYEQFAFEPIGTGYHPWGESSTIYRCSLT